MLKLLLFLLGLLLLGHTGCLGQSVKLTNTPRYGAPFIIMVAQGALVPGLETKIKAYKDPLQSTYLLINGDVLTPEAVLDTVNNLLNSPLPISKEYVYLVIAGDDAFYQQQNRYTTDFFATTWFLRADSAPNLHADINVSAYYSTALSDLVPKLRQHYTWQIEVKRIKADNVSEVKRNKKEFGIGFRWGQAFPLVKVNKELVPTSIRALSLTGYRRVSNRVQVNATLSAGFDFPNPRKIFEEQVQDQLDIASILNGDQVTMRLNTEIKAHFYISAAFDVRYFLLTNSTFQPYVGLGLSTNMLMNLRGEIDTLVSIDPGDILSGGGGFDIGNGFDENSAETDFERTLYRSSGIPVSLGFQQMLGRKLAIDVNMRYDINPSSKRLVEDLSLGAFSFGVGLNFNLLGRRKYYYDYVRLKE